NLRKIARSQPVAQARPLENFDIRSDDLKQARSLADSRRQKLGRVQQLKLENLSASFQVSADALRNRVPGLSVENNPATHVPETVDARSNGPIFLTAPATENHEAIVRRFLSENSSLYGLTLVQIEQLKLTADYTNPSGNLSWVEFQQEINGIPVFQGYL